MKFTAIISEYNPFHNGHAYHIRKTREAEPDSYIVCIMSGHFVQRGEPAIADKWSRARTALTDGADAVFELPFLFATQSAEGFATGAVRVADALGCVTHISFGAETADMDALSACAGLLSQRQPQLDDLIKGEMARGISYPSARANAIQSIAPGQMRKLIASPNNILAVEYLKALKKIESAIVPMCIERKGGGYNDPLISGDFAGAAALRNEIAQNGFSEKLTKYMPEIDFTPLTDMDAYSRLVLYRLRQMDTDEISGIAEVTEGLEHRIKKAAGLPMDIDSLAMQIKSKRYTYTRLKRILLYCLFGVQKETLRHVNDGTYGLYARLLGFRRESERLISRITSKSTIPVLTRKTDFFENTMLRYDIAASDIYALLNTKILPGGQDFTQKLIVV
jgi:predicted nucleotidyltransferase